MRNFLKLLLVLIFGLIFSTEMASAEETRILTLSDHLRFGTVNIGESATRELILYNNGNSDLTINGIRFHEKLNGVYSGDWNGVIEANSSQTVTITFRPEGAIRSSGLLYVESDRTNTEIDRSRSVIGTGANIECNKILKLGTHLNFGTVKIGESATRNLTLYNKGTCPLNISTLHYHEKIENDYSGSWSGIIPPNGLKEIAITFTPTEVGIHNGLVYAYSDRTNGGDRNRLLQGVAIPNDGNDTTPPVITLNGSNNITVSLGDSYNELNATAIDNTDGNVTDTITISGDVITSAVGTYTLTYTAHDVAGNIASKERTVHVVVEHIENTFNDPDINSEHNIHTVGIDMSEGTLKLVLDGGSGDTTFPFIWVANSGEGTISLLSTETGAELARYRTGPTSGGNPSRTTVDQDGNVWVGNRNGNTITKIGLNAWDQCIDRNGNGVIDTSTGGTDVKAWTGWFGDEQGITNAEDECVLQHVTLAKDGLSANWVRLVAIDADNNVFAGGSGSNALFKVNGTTGVIIDAVTTLQNHYGGVVDKNGNIWSMPPSHNGTVQKISHDMSSKEKINIGHGGYGITIDKYGKVWTTELHGNRFSAFNPSDPTGTLTVFNQTGHSGAQGVASDNRGNIFIAGNIWGNTVGEYRQQFDVDGNFIGVEFVKNHAVQNGPTGVAVDATGKVWASNRGSNSVSRIDPITEVVNHFPVGSGPYNYSDMTGSVVRNITEKTGTWEATFNSEEDNYSWSKVNWRLKEALPAETTLKVFAKVANSEINLAAQAYVEIQSGQPINLIGKFLKIKVELATDNLTKTPEVIEISLF